LPDATSAATLQTRMSTALMKAATFCLFNARNAGKNGRDAAARIALISFICLSSNKKNCAKALTKAAIFSTSQERDCDRNLVTGRGMVFETPVLVKKNYF